MPARPSSPAPEGAKPKAARKRPKVLCGANKTDGSGTCRRPAGDRTDHPGIGHCAFHGGKTPNGRKSAARKRLVAEAEARTAALAAAADRLGLRREVDPAQALLELIWEAAANVEYYRSLVQRLGLPGADKAPDNLGTLYGYLFHQTGEPTGEAVRHVAVHLYDDERDRLGKLVREALALKLDERRVQLAEAEGRELMRAVADAIGAAQLSPEQAEVFRRELATRLRARIGVIAEPAGLPR